MRGVSAELISIRDSLPEVPKECHQKVHTAPSIDFLVLHLIDDDLDVLDSSLNGICGFLQASFFAQQEHVEESGGGCGESQEEVVESEEGAEWTGAVEVTGGGEGGGGGGGWQGGDGLSPGVKSREFPRLLNHSTRQAKQFDSRDTSGVLSRMGGTKVKVGVGATVNVGVEANSVTGGEPRPLAPLPLAAYQVVPLLDLPLSRGIEIST
jgi:hypothetical protein